MELYSFFCTKEQFERLKADPEWSVIDPESKEKLRLLIPAISMIAKEYIKEFGFTDEDRVI